MSSYIQISLEDLYARIGRPDCPVLIDGRINEDFEADPCMIPGSFRLSCFDAEDWAARFIGREVVVICDRGLKLSEGAGAWLRHAGVRAVNVAGGYRGWRDAGYPVIPDAVVPPRDAKGRTIWVTGENPKVDRIACPWLIRRFVDPNAVFLFVSSGEVQGVADRMGATPFDSPGTFWSGHGDGGAFDTMMQEFALTFPPLKALARIVRGADTGRADLVPEAAGLSAISNGLSTLHQDALARVDAGMGLYDALFARLRDAAETHSGSSGAAVEGRG